MKSLGRSFNGLWFGTGAANLGDGMALFALPLLAQQEIGASPGGVAAVTMVLTLAWPVFGLHAGWIVDLAARRALMTSVNLVRGGALAVLTLAVVSGDLTLPLVLAAAALLGVAETLVDTSLTSTVPLVAPPESRTRANARIEATISVTNQLAGPPLAGALAGVTIALATGASAALYVLAVAGLAAMVLRNTPAKAGGLPLSGLTAGLRFLWRQPVIRTLTLFTAGMNLVWGAALALLVVHALRPGPQGLGLTAAQYGLMLTAMAAGGIAAATLVEPLRRRIGATRLLVADMVGTVLLVAPVAAGTGAWVVAAGLVAAGGGATVWRILVATIRQNLTPPDLLGRVYSASRVISWGAPPVGAGLAAVGAELWGVRPVFAVATAAAVATLAAFVPFAVRHDLSTALTSSEPASGIGTSTG